MLGPLLQLSYNPRTVSRIYCKRLEESLHHKFGPVT